MNIAKPVSRRATPIATHAMMMTVDEELLEVLSLVEFSIGSHVLLVQESLKHSLELVQLSPAHLYNEEVLEQLEGAVEAHVPFTQIFP